MRKIARLIKLNAGICIGVILLTILKAKPVFSAERVIFSIPVLGDFYVSVDSLETFAKTGEITSDFEFYAKRLQPHALNQLRQVLRHRLDISPVTVSRLTNMPMGEDYLKRVGQIVSTHRKRNGMYALRSALILAAADPDGLSLLNIMRQFPTQDMRIDSNLVFSLIKESANYLEYNKTTVEAIAQEAEAELNKTQLSQSQDLRQRGAYQVVKETRTFQIDRVRQTLTGLSSFYRLDADLYFPQDFGKPAPLIVITHGFGSNRFNYSYLAEHLASHGFVVVVPEHIGSDSEYQQAFLRGELSVDVSPIEFISRPLDVTYLLDALESTAAKNLEWQGKIKFDQIGVIGHSFGGATALLLAGAELNRARLRQECDRYQFTLNASLMLQCRARYLPPGEYRLRDPRIKAALAVSPVTSIMLGPEGMGEIEIPTMVLGGSQDIVAPFIAEQAHPFLWLNATHRYLGLMTNGTHSSTSNAEEVAKMAKIMQGPRPDLGRGYLKALSLAFMEVYVRDRSDYQPYLSTSYTQTISGDALPLHLIKSLTPQQLEKAYGDVPPKPPIPEPVVAVEPQADEILAEIRRTGVLKIAMRSNAPPFGYIDPQQDLWTGYCSDLADALGTYLANKLNLGAGVEVIKLPSTAENRSELVKDTVHLECGPNTITEDAEVNFSNAFFITGTNFLVETDKNIEITPEDELNDLSIGVLENTLTEQFIRQNYPQANIVSFSGEKGRAEGVKAIATGEIDTFASDGVLLAGEVARQNLEPKQFQLVPEKPLTCDFYGLILPQSDRQWQSTVNSFLSDRQLELREKWTTGFSDKLLSDLDYCVNQQR
ncbi:alpha/beta fold hydrolase [Myxosarcina sp. GI1]|uniref:alpha/beta fold hydrolase n=1 Tax=Myxosarcina sp. GI1 TaxID=1541065 RepID=UPI00068AB258|nr:alpha/beta fold hydrolase [Myxosarcina sp. GI1]